VGGLAGRTGVAWRGAPGLPGGAHRFCLAGRTGVAWRGAPGLSGAHLAGRAGRTGFERDAERDVAGRTGVEGGRKGSHRGDGCCGAAAGAG
jgi:hypothetical protein